MTVSRNRVLAVLVPSERVAVVLVDADHIVAQMTGNAFFPSPTPALSGVQASIDTLRAAQLATTNRAPGSTGARNRALAALLRDLHMLRGYVQMIADMNPDKAVSIIVSAGFAVKKPADRHKPGFEVRDGRLSGQARLIALSQGKRVCYRWQISTDGVTFTDLPMTLAAKTQVEGLEAAKRYWFRFAVVTKNGQGNWCDAHPFVVK